MITWEYDMEWLRDYWVFLAVAIGFAVLLFGGTWYDRRDCDSQKKQLSVYIDCEGAANCKMDVGDVRQMRRLEERVMSACYGKRNGE